MVPPFSLYNVDVHRPFYFDLDLFWTFQKAEKHLQQRFFMKNTISPRSAAQFSNFSGVYMITVDRADDSFIHMMFCFRFDLVYDLVNT